MKPGYSNTLKYSTFFQKLLGKTSGKCEQSKGIISLKKA